MNTFILVIWTVVASVPHLGAPDTIYKAWRPIGEFKNEAACKFAATAYLGLDDHEFRCIPTK